MLYPYALKAFAEQLNEIKVYDDGITPMDNFSGTKTDINLKYHHTWDCPVYVLDKRLQGKIYEIPKWETRSRADIYLGNSPFNEGSAALVIKPKTVMSHLNFMWFLMMGSSIHERRHNKPKLYRSCATHLKE